MRPITINIGGKGKHYLTELKERLEKHDIKAADLAREAGYDRSQISRWFNTPTMNITLQNIVRLEQAFATLQRRKARRRIAKSQEKESDE